jgi:hypothetical protein
MGIRAVGAKLPALRSALGVKGVDQISISGYFTLGE